MNKAREYMDAKAAAAAAVAAKHRAQANLGMLEDAGKTGLTMHRRFDMDYLVEQGHAQRVDGRYLINRTAQQGLHRHGPLSG